MSPAEPPDPLDAATDPRGASAGEVRGDFFARELGEEWQPVEPGIYRFLPDEQERNAADRPRWEAAEPGIYRLVPDERDRDATDQASDASPAVTEPHRGHAAVLDSLFRRLHRTRKDP